MRVPRTGILGLSTQHFAAMNRSASTSSADARNRSCAFTARSVSISFAKSAWASTYASSATLTTTDSAWRSQVPALFF